MKAIIDCRFKYHATCVLRHCFVGILSILFITFSYSQGTYKLSAGLHSSDISAIKDISNQWSLDNKNLNYHATIGYVQTVSLVFLDANVGIDVDRYEIDNITFNQVKLIAPVQVGVKILMFDLKTGIIGRYTVNEDPVLQQVRDIDRISLQYLNGIGIRFKKLGLALDYSSSSPVLVGKFFDDKLKVDNQISDRLFLTLSIKFGSDSE